MATHDSSPTDGNGLEDRGHLDYLDGPDDPASSPGRLDSPGHLNSPGHPDSLDSPDGRVDRFGEHRRAIEAVLMVADAPVEPSLLAQLLEVAPSQVEVLCEELAQSYRREQRGFVLARVAGGYRFQSHPDLAPYIERFVLEGQSARLSAAALETLAIVAYKQPISRAQVAAIRGVNADAVLRTLCHRGYVCEVARDPGPGQAVLYGTSPLLLERLGLDKIEDLPPLGEFVPGPEIMDALEQGLRSG
jgi:segregation and condensation protein B